MQFEVSKEQLEDLLDLANMAETVLDSVSDIEGQQDRGHAERLWGTCDFIKNFAFQSGLDDRVVIDHGKPYIKRTSEANKRICRLMDQHQIVESLVFLVDEFANRDARRKLEKVNKADEPSVYADELYEQAFKRYELEMREHGIDRLEVVPRRPANAAEFGFTPMPREIPEEVIYRSPRGDDVEETDEEGGIELMALEMERRILEADGEASAEGLTLTDSQVRSILLKVRKKWDGGNPDVPKGGLRDEIMAKLFDKISGYPNEFTPEMFGVAAEVWEVVKRRLFFGAIGVVEESMTELRSNRPGSRDYLDYLGAHFDELAKESLENASHAKE